MTSSSAFQLACSAAAAAWVGERRNSRFALLLQLLGSIENAESLLRCEDALSDSVR